MCPACFSFDSSESQDRAIHLSVDGNLQQTRFADKIKWEFEKFKMKLFVAFGVKNFPLATEADSSPCGHNFKATKGWNKTEVSTATKKSLDETGLLTATCFHGVALRYLNMHGSGERHSHAETILKAIIEEVDSYIGSDPKGDIRICYDVACVFETAIWRLLPEYKDRITVRIGRFHQYAHGLSCQINYNSMRTDGFGLMVGEEPELIWFLMNLLVKIGRVSSGPRKAQKIDSWGLYNAKRMQQAIGENLSRRWKKMLQLKRKAEETLTSVIGQEVAERRDKTGKLHPKRVVTRDYLEEQIEEQISYYKTYE
jgi:hypothetical protein